MCLLVPNAIQNNIICVYVAKKWVLTPTVWGFRNVKHKNKQAFIVEIFFFVPLFSGCCCCLPPSRTQHSFRAHKNALNLSLMCMYVASFNVQYFCEFYFPKKVMVVLKNVYKNIWKGNEIGLKCRAQQSSALWCNFQLI